MDNEVVELLLVEDNPYDIELTLEALKSHNVTNNIRVVRDGAEALDYLFAAGEYAGRNVEHVPKIVFLDLKLPKVDGFEVLKAIRSDTRTRDLPVVILTSSAEEADIIKGYKLGVNSYIVKPVDMEKFVQAVRDVGIYWVMLNKPPVF